MFKRQIFDDLIRWKNSPRRKPLVLRGARQVGKTTLVHQLGETYTQYIHLNLELDQKLFLDLNEIEPLVEAIFFLNQKDISKASETLLFIDEIQEVPGAINLLRYFYEKFPNLHVIAAGSLLETLLQDDTKFPVGRVEFMVVRPFSFTEFLMASEENHLVKALSELESKPYAIEILFNHFHKYTLIGGMPEIVESYVHYNNLNHLSTIYDSLLHAYMNDVSKYAKNSTMSQVIRHCIHQVFFNGGKRITYTHFGNSNYRAREVGEALNTLQRTMLLQLVFPFTNYNIPLEINFRKRPKLILLDTGLMNYFAGLQPDLIGSNDISELYAGHLAEQIVGQEISSSFLSPLSKLTFWVNDKKGSEAEVDFVMQYKGLLIPIEVKSGKIGKLKSLLQFMDFSKQSIAVRLYKGNLLVHKAQTPNGHQFTLINLPYFLAAYIEIYVDKVLTRKIKLES